MVGASQWAQSLIESTRGWGSGSALISSTKSSNWAAVTSLPRDTLVISSRTSKRAGRPVFSMSSVWEIIFVSMEAESSPAIKALTPQVPGWLILNCPLKEPQEALSWASSMRWLVPFGAVRSI